VGLETNQDWSASHESSFSSTDVDWSKPFTDIALAKPARERSPASPGGLPRPPAAPGFGGLALNIEDIEEAPDGMKITIRHGKTDQEGAGQTTAIPFGKIACPVAALKEWITAAGISSGALFRSVNRHGKVGERLTDQSVSDIVKEHAERLRLDPTQFAGHSLRAGFLTSAAARGASIFKMMDVSRHRSVDTLRGYVRDAELIRDAELFKDHAGAGLL
jgi:integrase